MPFFSEFASSPAATFILVAAIMASVMVVAIARVIEGP